MLRDAQGRHWTLGAKDGKWYMHDGRAWVLANPPVATTPISATPVTAPQKSQSKSNKGCLIGGCVVLMLVCVLSVGGGFWAYQSGAFTFNNLLNLVGLGPGSIEVDNFRDDKIEVKITQLEPPKDSSPILKMSFRLSPLIFDLRLLHNPENIAWSFPRQIKIQNSAHVILMCSRAINISL